MALTIDNWNTNPNRLWFVRLYDATTGIGAELYLSENTIRWYASQIYLKLGAAGRTAAAAAARKLGLI